MSTLTEILDMSYPLYHQTIQQGTAWFFRQLKRDIYKKENQLPCKSESTKESLVDGGGHWAPPGGWVRPLSSMEALYAVGNMNTAQVLYLESTSPITFQLVHHALTILAEWVPLLAIVFCKEDMQRFKLILVGCIWLVDASLVSDRANLYKAVNV